MLRMYPAVMRFSPNKSEQAHVSDIRPHAPSQRVSLIPRFDLSSPRLKALQLSLRIVHSKTCPDDNLYFSREDGKIPKAHHCFGECRVEKKH